jgi:hypothetical protein
MVNEYGEAWKGSYIITDLYSSLNTVFANNICVGWGGG